MLQVLFVGGPLHGEKQTLPDTWSGFVFVAASDTRPIRPVRYEHLRQRSWAERLLSWPWRPWLATEVLQGFVLEPPAEPRRECYRLRLVDNWYGRRFWLGLHDSCDDVATALERIEDSTKLRALARSLSVPQDSINGL